MACERDVGPRKLAVMASDGIVGVREKERGAGVPI